jgi:hypothetical protein
MLTCDITSPCAVTYCPIINLPFDGISKPSSFHETYAYVHEIIKVIFRKREMRIVFTSGVGLPVAEHFSDTAGPG